MIHYAQLCTVETCRVVLPMPIHKSIKARLGEVSAELAGKHRHAPHIWLARCKLRQEAANQWSQLRAQLCEGVRTDFICDLSDAVHPTLVTPRKPKWLPITLRCQRVG